MRNSVAKSMNRRINVAKIPFIRGHLTIGMKIPVTDHQFQLFLGKVRVHDHDWKRMERQVPGCIPWVLPLVGHGNNVFVQHMEPFPSFGILYPVVDWSCVRPANCYHQRKKLLAPEHACKGLSHHVGSVSLNGWRYHRLVKFIGREAVELKFRQIPYMKRASEDSLFPRLTTWFALSDGLSRWRTDQVLSQTNSELRLLFPPWPFGVTAFSLPFTTKSFIPSFTYGLSFSCAGEKTIMVCRFCE